MSSPFSLPQRAKIAVFSLDTPNKASQQAQYHARLGLIFDALTRHGLNSDHCIRKRPLPKELDDYDWIIAIGGDGTILEAAQQLRDKPMTALRLYPEISIGFLADCDAQDFPQYLEGIVQGKAQLESYQRLQALIDGEAQKQAVLNDLLFCHQAPASSTRYQLDYRGESKIHCSSGLWFATALGSHAAIASQRRPRLPPRDPRLLFAVRELSYLWPLHGDAPPLYGYQLSPDEETRYAWGLFTPGLDSSPRIHSIGHDNQLYADGGLWKSKVLHGQILEVRAHPKALQKLRLPNFHQN